MLKKIAVARVIWVSQIQGLLEIPVHTKDAARIKKEKLPFEQSNRLTTWRSQGVGCSSYFSVQ